MKPHVPALILVLGMLSTAVAQVSITTVGTVGYSQNFDSLPISPGVQTDWVDNSILPGWYAGGRSGSDYATPSLLAYRPLTPEQTVGANAGPQVNALATSTADRSLGLQANNTLNSSTLPLALGLRLTNNTGVTIDAITLSFDIEQWTQGYTTPTTGSIHERLAFSWSATATGLNPLTNTFTDVPGLLVTAPVGTQTSNSSTTIALNGNDPANRTVISSFELSLGEGWAPGADLWLRWYVPDALTASARSGILSIDNLSITAHAAVPEPAAYAGLAAAAVLSLAFLRRRHPR